MGLALLRIGFSQGDFHGMSLMTALDWLEVYAESQERAEADDTDNVSRGTQSDIDNFLA